MVFSDHTQGNTKCDIETGDLLSDLQRHYMFFFL